MLDDLKTALRRLRRAQLFAASAIGIIALAIAANATIFGVADAVLFRPLPYDHPEDICIVRVVDVAAPAQTLRRPVPPEYIQVLQRHRGIVGLGMRGSETTGASPGSNAEWFSSITVTPAYFRILGVRPVRGRLFDERDTVERGRIAMLSYDSWQRRFGGDPRIVGQSFTVGPQSKLIIGVLPRGFVFPAAFRTTPSTYGAIGWPDYVTVAREPLVTGDPRSLSPFGVGGGVEDPVVRLKPSVTREQAQAELDGLIRPLQETDARLKTARPILEGVRSVVFPTGQRILALLVAAAGLVLLLACANLAIMLLARTRRSEAQFGIQLALGASRSRIVRPLLFEAMVIGLVGAVAGLLGARLAFDAVIYQVPRVAYGSASVGIDVRTAALALCLGLASGVLFGVLPAWRATRLDVQALIQGQAGTAIGRRRLLARPLVALQTTLAIVLLFAAVVVGGAFVAVLRVQLGFNPENVATFTLSPPDDPASPVVFYQRALETIRQRPDVISAGVGYSVPLDGSFATGSEDRRVLVDTILPGYLETIGAHLVAGRLPGWDDVRAKAKVAIVSESAAHTLDPGANPLGHSIRLARGTEVWIIGVVRDVRASLDDKLQARFPPVAYTLIGDEKTDMTVVVHVRTRGPRVLEDIRTELARMSPPGNPVVARWWADYIDTLVPLRTPRFQTLILGSFAALALALTALGIFAVVSFVVAARTCEMGVRMALGASGRSLVVLVVRQAFMPVVAGALLAVLVSRWLNVLIEAQLFSAHAGSAALLVATVTAVLAVALVAAYLPARRASRVNPVDVLRAP